MHPQDAVYMINAFPNTTAVEVRHGYSEWATGLGAQVESLMQYSGGASSQFFAAADNAIWDVTAGGEVGNYLNLPGAAGDYASTPDSAALDIVGDIEMVVYAAATDWTPSVTGDMIAKFSGVGDQRSYRLRLDSTGFLIINWSTDGTVGGTVVKSSTVAPTISNGSGLWIKCTLDVDNGAGGNAVQFFTSTDPQSTAPADIAWTQLGATVTTVGVTSIYASSALLEIGSNSGGLSNNFVGKIYSAYVYSGIGGALVASFVANNTIPGDTSFVSTLTGETWTVNGAASIIGTKDVIATLNSRWQYVNNTTSGGSYLQAVNGEEKMRVYDGTAWHQDGDGAPYNVTGVDSADCINITLVHNRIWLTEIDTLKAWYGPTGSIGGAFNAIDLSSIAQRGGYLMAICDWTMDAGYGMDDMTVFLTSNGEVLVYKGADPSDATTFTLIGRYWMGSPIGRRCFIQLGGDLLIINEDGVVSMAAALQSSRVTPKASLSNRIQQAISAAVADYKANFGWQIIQYPAQNMLILNVPVSAGQQEQFVMSTIKRSNRDWAWCRFTGWAANCWELWEDDIYFGGDGVVGKAWDTLYDNGANIDSRTLQAFSNFGSAGSQNRFTMMQPAFLSNGSPSIFAGLNIQFNLADNSTPLSFVGTPFGAWDSATWDSSIWDSALSPLQSWQGVTGIGVWAAPLIKTATGGLQLQWANTVIVMERAYPGFAL